MDKPKSHKKTASGPSLFGLLKPYKYHIVALVALTVVANGLNLFIPKLIAHRLNTIETADEIFFVNGGAIKPAGSFAQAVEMLMHGKRMS